MRRGDETTELLCQFTISAGNKAHYSLGQREEAGSCHEQKC